MTGVYAVADLPPRIADRIEIDPVDGCWRWTGSTTLDNYGRTWWEGCERRVHRVAYHLLADPTFPVTRSPAGEQLDHDCHNSTDCTDGNDCLHRRCCNPAHLNVVDARTNTRTGRRVGGVSDAIGVHWYARSGKWRAEIAFDGRQRYLGYYDDERQAAAAYDAASMSLGYGHPNTEAGRCQLPQPSDVEDIETRWLHRPVHVPACAARGVNRDRGKFQARINIDKRQRYLGNFDTEREAARTYDAASLLLGRGTPNTDAGRCLSPSPLDIQHAADRIEQP